jgi:four helix bundle protein
MAGTYKDLKVYQKAFTQALGIFRITANFDKSEKYSLTDQIRRSSRSVCANLGEAYRKRQYESYFISKISDADMENTETQIWLDFALEFRYITPEKHAELTDNSMEIGRLLNHMMQNPAKYRGTMRSK